MAAVEWKVWRYGSSRVWNQNGFTACLGLYESMDLINHIVLQPSCRMIRVGKEARHITVEVKTGKEASP